MRTMAFYRLDKITSTPLRAKEPPFCAIRLLGVHPQGLSAGLVSFGVSLPSEAVIRPVPQGGLLFYAVEISGNMIRTVETEFGGDLSDTVMGRY